MSHCRAMPGSPLGVSRHGSSVTSNTSLGGAPGAACLMFWTMSGHMVWQCANTNVRTTGLPLKRPSETFSPS